MNVVSQSISAIIVRSTPSLVALIVSFALLGCSNMTRREMRDKVASAKPCCTALSQLDFRTFPDKVFDINEKDAFYLFDTGGSFTKSFVLPSYESGFRMRVTSYSNQISSGYFQPDLLFLDQEFAMCEEVDQLLIKLPGYRVVGPFQTAISAEFELTPRGHCARYLIIRTTDKTQSTRISAPPGRGYMVVSPSVVIPIENRGTVSSWPIGEMRLEFMPVTSR